MLGFRYGYKGLTAGGLVPRVLTREVADRIGGVAGTSRGPQHPAEMGGIEVESALDVGSTSTRSRW